MTRERLPRDLADQDREAVRADKGAEPERIVLAEGAGR